MNWHLKLYGSPGLDQVRTKFSDYLYRLPEIDFVPRVKPDKELITQDICLPPLFGPTDHDDLTPLLTLVKELGPDLVVEFGTGYGNTTANICRLTESKVITVNALAEQISGRWITYALTSEEIGRVYRRYGFADRVSQVYANTLDLDLSRYISPFTIDLGIIDACHDNDYVISDFQKMVPFVRPGGVIMLHDTHPIRKGHLSGSYSACKYLRKWGWNVLHIQNTWWGIWVNGKIDRSKIRHLLARPKIWPVWNYIRPMG